MPLLLLFYEGLKFSLLHREKEVSHSCLCTLGSNDNMPVVTNAHVVCSNHEAQHTSVGLNGHKLFFKSAYLVKQPTLKDSWY